MKKWRIVVKLPIDKIAEIKYLATMDSKTIGEYVGDILLMEVNRIGIDKSKPKEWWIKSIPCSEIDITK